VFQRLVQSQSFGHKSYILQDKAWCYLGSFRRIGNVDQIEWTWVILSIFSTVGVGVSSQPTNFCLPKISDTTFGHFLVLWHEARVRVRSNGHKQSLANASPVQTQPTQQRIDLPPFGVCVCGRSDFMFPPRWIFDFRRPSAFLVLEFFLTGSESTFHVCGFGFVGRINSLHFGSCLWKKIEYPRSGVLDITDFALFWIWIFKSINFLEFQPYNFGSFLVHNFSSKVLVAFGILSQQPRESDRMGRSHIFQILKNWCRLDRPMCIYIYTFCTTIRVKSLWHLWFFRNEDQIDWAQDIFLRFSKIVVGSIGKLLFSCVFWHHHPRLVVMVCGILSQWGSHRMGSAAKKLWGYILLHQHPSQGVIVFVILMQLGSDRMGEWHNFGILTNREISNIPHPAVFCLFGRIDLPRLWIWVCREDLRSILDFVYWEYWLPTAVRFSHRCVGVTTRHPIDFPSKSLEVWVIYMRHSLALWFRSNGHNTYFPDVQTVQSAPNKTRPFYFFPNLSSLDLILWGIDSQWGLDLIGTRQYLPHLQICVDTQHNTTFLGLALKHFYMIHMVGRAASAASSSSYSV